MSLISYRDMASRGAPSPGNYNLFGSTFGSADDLWTDQLGEPLGFRADPVGFNHGNCSLQRDWVSQLPIRLVSLLDIKSNNLSKWSIVVQLERAAGAQPPVTVFASIFTYPESLFVRHAHAVLTSSSGLGGTNQAFNDFTGIRIVVNFVGSAVAGDYLTIGRLWAGLSWELPFGIERRWSHTIQDPGVINISRGNQGHERREQRLRVHEGNFVQVPYANAFGGTSEPDLQSIAMEVGNTSPCILIPRVRLPNQTLDQNSIHRLGCYGHFTAPIKITNTAGDFFGASFTFRELL